MRDRRAAIAGRYLEAFADLPLEMPPDAPSGDAHAWHLFVVRLAAGAPVDRDAFIASVTDAGVGCSVHFIPLHMHSYWRESLGVTDADFPVATAEFARVASLPIYSGMTDAQVERVIRAVRGALS